MELTFSTPCSCSDPSLSCQGAALLHVDSLPSDDLIIWMDDYFSFYFGKGGSGILANCSLRNNGTTLSYSPSPVYSNFSAEACAILLAFFLFEQHQQDCHFSSLLLLSHSSSVLATLSSILLSHILWWELSFLLSYTMRLHWVPRHSFLPGNDTVDEFTRWSVLLQPSTVPCSLSLTTRIHSSFFLD